LNKGKWCIGIFLDLKKAFDTVQHEILLIKLAKFGISGNLLEWFKSYLSNRTQCVDINGTQSDLANIIMSVLQGSWSHFILMFHQRYISLHKIELISICGRYQCSFQA
jgi:Reverse transcriptase (RNA-dependent DNA polymerase)